MRPYLRRAARFLQTTPWYPPTSAGAFVLLVHLNTGLNLFSATRAVLGAMLATALAQGFMSAVLRSRQRGAIVAMFALLGMLGWQAARFFWNTPEWRFMFLVSVPALTLIGLGILWNARNGGPQLLELSAMSRALGSFPIILIIAASWAGVTSGALVADLRDVAIFPQTQASAAASKAGSPDIWLILLDGHARADVLRRVFDHDGEPFLASLRSQGLVVANRSRSNYTATELTLPSLFHMRLLHDIPELAPVLEGGRVEPTLREVLNDNPVFNELRARGYEIVTSPPPWEDVTLRSADRYLDGGQLNDFELLLVLVTGLADTHDAVAPDFLSQQHRDRLLTSFRHIDDELDRTTRSPRLLLIHVPGPHMPAVFDAEGRPVRTETARFYTNTIAERGIGADEFRRRYLGELQYLDRLAVDAVKNIVARDPNAVVIVFSDHGSLSGLDNRDHGHSDFDEAFSNLLAARTPGHGNLFLDNVTPVNLFPVLFNAYFDTDLPISPNRTFASRADSPFDLSEMPNPDGGS